MVKTITETGALFFAFREHPLGPPRLRPNYAASLAAALEIHFALNAQFYRAAVGRALRAMSLLNPVNPKTPVDPCLVSK